MMHGPGDVKINSSSDTVYICACGEIRRGDMVEAGKQMREHEEAARWRGFMDDALTHRKVWILGREIQL